MGGRGECFHPLASAAYVHGIIHQNFVEHVVAASLRISSDLVWFGPYWFGLIWSTLIWIAFFWYEYPYYIARSIGNMKMGKLIWFYKKGLFFPKYKMYTFCISSNLIISSCCKTIPHEGCIHSLKWRSYPCGIIL